MSITSYTDIVIAICILVSVLVGYHRGFLVTIARIVAMVASYIGAILAAEMLKKTLAQTLFVPMIRQGLGNGAFADLAQEALLQTAEGHCVLGSVFCGICAASVCFAACDPRPEACGSYSGARYDE